MSRPVLPSAPRTLVVLFVVALVSGCGGNAQKGGGNGTTVYLLNSLRQNLVVHIQGPHQAATQATLVTTDQGNSGPTLPVDITAQVGDLISFQAIAGTVTGPTFMCTVTQDTANCGGVVMILGTSGDSSCENWWAEYSGTPPDADCVAQ